MLLDTLAVVADRHRYTRLDTHRWRLEQQRLDLEVEFDVDHHGVPVDMPERFRRLRSPQA